MSGYDERRTGLIDQDAVRLVHDSKVQSAQYEPFNGTAAAVNQSFHSETKTCTATAQDNPVSKVVESELLVGAVRDVARVGSTAFVGAPASDDNAHRQPEEVV